jgi:hypothetical protein
MILKKLFGKKETVSDPDPVSDLTLSNLKPGYYVDFDLKSWQVEARHYYDWGDGDITHEWQLKSHDETRYLEKDSDDEDTWSWSQRVPIGRIGSAIADHIINHDDPPEQIEYEGTMYYMDEMSGGQYFQNSQGPGKDMLRWDFIDGSGRKFLSIEQWGEKAFEAAIGEAVEEYQFNNILPGTSSSANQG